MPDTGLHLLVDQNVPAEVTHWLQIQRPHWRVQHAGDLGFASKPDTFLYKWAQRHQAIILTFDEDFADARFYPLGEHHGVIRLRVWPTTIEETEAALARLLESVGDDELIGSLVIIDAHKIRIRRHS